METEKLIFEYLESKKEVEVLLVSEEGKEPAYVKEFPHTYITASLFQELSSFPSKEEVILVAKGGLKKDIQQLKEAPLVLDRIQDPGNMGTIIRSAEAFSFSSVLAIDSCEFENPKALRASMGSSFRLDLFALSLEEFLENNSYPLLGADMEGVDYRSFLWDKDYALVIGNEGQGIDPKIRSHIRHFLSIPMGGQVESLNAAIAASLLMASKR